jgi:magnesium chelatase subunit D
LQEEILGIAAKVYLSGHSLLVIDTENKFVSTGFAKEIARVAQGEPSALCSALAPSALVFLDE